MKIVVPIRIEGKYLEKPEQVSSPLADFTKLPWTDGKSDYNFEQPYVANGIIHEPFGDENTMLGKGLHLHFIIPHYLDDLHQHLLNPRELMANPLRPKCRPHPIDG